MTVQEIHEYVWNGIIHALKSKKHVHKHNVMYNIGNGITYDYVTMVKYRILQKMYDNEMISHEALLALMKSSMCVMCAVYNEDCAHCPLEYSDNICCNTYSAVVYGHSIEAARWIRDLEVLSGHNIDDDMAEYMRRMVKVLES